MTFEEWWLNFTESSKMFPEILARDAWKAAQPQWQPIDSAPNGSGFLLLYDKREFIGFWGKVAWHEQSTGKEIKPTHWMPLPEPPDV